LIGRLRELLLNDRKSGSECGRVATTPEIVIKISIGYCLIYSFEARETELDRGPGRYRRVAMSEPRHA
jgi:hypothetical protein